MVTKSICIISTVDVTLSSFVLPVAKQLQLNGYTVVLMSSMSSAFVESHKDEFTLINVEMERGAKPLGMLKAIWCFFKIFRKEKFDIIQYATPNAAFYASVASKFAGCQKRVYCQWGIRYVGFSGMTRRLFKVLEKITCLLSTHIRPASQKNLEFAVSEGLYRSSKANIIGNGGTIGIDFNKFNIENKASFKQQMIQIYPTLKDKFIFGFVGRLDKDKGVNELFEAFIEVHKQYPNTALVVLGHFDKPTGLNKQLLLQVQSLGSVVFTGSVKDVPKYISCFDILVHPSYREGFSMVIQQAMAMEIAVITTDIPGPSEVVVNNESGITVEAKSSTKLSEAMKELYNNQNKRYELANAGLIRAQRLFNRERMVKLTVADRLQISNE